MKYTTITENHLFGKAFKKGKRFRGSYVAVYVLPDYTAKRRMMANPRKEYINRTGISASKKLGSAVTRSRVSRIIREGCRAACKESPIKTGNLIVFGARNAAVGAKSTDIARELSVAFSALGLTLRQTV